MTIPQIYFVSYVFVWHLYCVLISYNISVPKSCRLQYTVIYTNKLYNYKKINLVNYCCITYMTNELSTIGGLQILYNGNCIHRYKSSKAFCLDCSHSSSISDFAFFLRYKGTLTSLPI